MYHYDEHGNMKQVESFTQGSPKEEGFMFFRSSSTDSSTPTTSETSSGSGKKMLLVVLLLLLVAAGVGGYLYMNKKPAGIVSFGKSKVYGFKFI